MDRVLHTTWIEFRNKGNNDIRFYWRVANQLSLVYWCRLKMIQFTFCQHLGFILFLSVAWLLENHTNCCEHIKSRSIVNKNCTCKYRWQHWRTIHSIEVSKRKKCAVQQILVCSCSTVVYSSDGCQLKSHTMLFCIPA